jgi:hypothetical protein
MRARFLIVLLALIGTALAGPPRKHKPTKKPPATAPAAGSDSGSGSAAGSGSDAGSASAAPDATPPAPAADVDTRPLPEAPPSSAPGATLPAPPPHAPTLAMRVQKSSQHNGFVGDLDCSACHTSEGWGLATTAGASGFDHDRTGFALRGAHKQTQCSGCHTGKVGAKPANNCEGCHRDPHEGRQVGTCAECHTAFAWSDTKTLEQHRRTRLPLTGRHAAIDCSDCHKRQGERMYSDTPADCYACHSKQYHDESVHPTHDGSTGLPLFPRDCAQCHQTNSWGTAFTDPTKLPGAPMARLSGDHDMYFVLSTGSHRTAECASCHPDPRRAQLVRCDGCHTSVAVRSQHRALVPAVATACLHCHPRGASR